MVAAAFLRRQGRAACTKIAGRHPKIAIGRNAVIGDVIAVIGAFQLGGHVEVIIKDRRAGLAELQSLQSWGQEAAKKQGQ